MAKQSPATYHKLLASIDRVKKLATGATLELNKNQCKYLSQELQESAMFVQRENVKQSILRYKSPPGSPSRRSEALLLLYSVVKRAENLVQQCCRIKGSSWLKRALTLFAVKDDVLDVLLHLRWWTSILSMVIDVPSSELSEPERVKSATQDFEQGLTSHDELQTAALEDKKQLLNRVNVEMQAHPDHGKSRGSKKPHGAHYLLLLQVHALLTGKDEHSTPQLNDYTYDSPNSLVGQGSFGVVNKVTWCGYDCVLKQYNTLKLEDIEVNSLKRLQHPHIVRFFRHWKDETIEKYKSNILMERLEKDLEEHIDYVQMKSGQTRPFSLPVTIDLMLQVMNAIWHMHDKGIVHRDLKPKNVLVRLQSESGLPELSAQGYVHVKLGDFGIAKADMMTSNAGALTHKAGTTLYRAPELAVKEYTQGTRNFPLKFDIWSFGIMCFRILSGEQPYNGIEGNNALQGHIENGGRPSIPDDCPDYLRFCIEKCWEKEPENRPRALDMWRMLRVAQLRSLGLIDQNYDFFMFNDHSNKQTLQLSPATPEGEGWRSDSSAAAVNQESVSFTMAAVNREFVSFTEAASRPHAVFHDSGNSLGIWGILQGSLFNES